jgi:hypothetical protein
MNTVITNPTRAVHRLSAIAIIGALALSFAAIATLAAETNITSGISAWMGDYITEVGEVLGAG